MCLDKHVLQSFVTSIKRNCKCFHCCLCFPLTKSPNNTFSHYDLKPLHELTTASPLYRGNGIAFREKKSTTCLEPLSRECRRSCSKFSPSTLKNSTVHNINHPFQKSSNNATQSAAAPLRRFPLFQPNINSHPSSSYPRLLSNLYPTLSDSAPLSTHQSKSFPPSSSQFESRPNNDEHIHKNVCIDNDISENVNSHLSQGKNVGTVDRFNGTDGITRGDDTISNCVVTNESQYNKLKQIGSANGNNNNNKSSYNNANVDYSIFNKNGNCNNYVPNTCIGDYNKSQTSSSNNTTTSSSTAIENTVSTITTNNRDGGVGRKDDIINGNVKKLFPSTSHPQLNYLLNSRPLLNNNGFTPPSPDISNQQSTTSINPLPTLSICRVSKTSPINSHPQSADVKRNNSLKKESIDNNTNQLPPPSINPLPSLSIPPPPFGSTPQSTANSAMPSSSSINLCENSTPVSTDNHSIHHDPTPVSQTKLKLSGLQDRLRLFEDQLEVETKRRREEEGGRVLGLWDSLSTLEKTLEGEIRRRVETNQLIQGTFESNISVMNSRLRRTFNDKYISIEAAVAGVNKRIDNIYGTLEVQREDQRRVKGETQKALQNAMDQIGQLQSTVEREIESRKGRELNVLNKLSQLKEEVEGRIKLEMGIRERDVSLINYNINNLSKLHISNDDEFQRELSEMFKDVKQSLLDEVHAREQSDDDIVQALNHYTSALQSALKISHQ